MDKAETNIQKQQLNDVMFMRPLAIVLLGYGMHLSYMREDGVNQWDFSLLNRIGG